MTQRVITSHTLTSGVAAALMLTLLAGCSGLGMGDNAATEKLITDTQALRKEGDAQKALSLLREANAATPNNPKILQQLGYTLIETKNHQEAVNIFEQLIQLDPAKATGYAGKAVALDHTGNHRLAQDAYKKALAIDPDYLPTKNNFAMSLILSNQAAEAITLLEPLITQNNADNDTVRRNLALAYGVNGDKEKALALDLQDMSDTEAKKKQDYYSTFAKTHHFPHSASRTAAHPDATAQKNP